MRNSLPDEQQQQQNLRWCRKKKPNKGLKSEKKNWENAFRLIPETCTTFVSHVLCNIVVIAAAVAAANVVVVVVVAAGHTLVGWAQSDISHIKKISSRIIFLFLFLYLSIFKAGFRLKNLFRTNKSQPEIIKSCRRQLDHLFIRCVCCEPHVQQVKKVTCFLAVPPGCCCCFRCSSFEFGYLSTVPFHFFFCFYLTENQLKYN